jgi:hypothetical protein
VHLAQKAAANLVCNRIGENVKVSLKDNGCNNSKRGYGRDLHLFISKRLDT